MSKELEDKITKLFSDEDPTASSRKKDHIDLAFKSQIEIGNLDRRFYYEPLLSAHPTSNSYPQLNFLNKEMKVPIWVSSMTGGTGVAKTINQNLAKACGEFGMGMGLGSCRSLLYSNETLADFDVRHLITDEFPLYANLGVAQVEKLIKSNEVFLVNELLSKLKADGLIIHVNPFQEWLQPEGDRFEESPIDTIKEILKTANFPIIVKEVGQGMGIESLKALFELPIAAVDFAASGGTNFSNVELLRSDVAKQETFSNLGMIGHTADEMVDYSNQILKDSTNTIKCKEVIISGGVKNFLDGYYLINKLAFTSVYGQASGFLKHSMGDYTELKEYVEAQIAGLEIANAYLKVR